MITFIKIVFAWKLDNKPSYHRAPAVQFDNNQHLQIYFSKYTPPPTRCSRLYKMPRLLEKNLGTMTPDPYPKTKQTKQENYSTPSPQQNSKIFSS